ncbi:MAG: 1-acyl-sn-glycerol-3-phosphate acyltransferase [Clostridia bacterium]|nr:1-acyl-sn-glycerol-3-phosphate acyltransferase [Clostridia bacterium]
MIFRKETPVLLRLFFAISAVFSVLLPIFIEHIWPWIPVILVGSFAALTALGVIFLFIASLFCYTKKPIEKDNAFCRLLGYHTMDCIIAACNAYPHGEGLEKVPDEPFVLVCNHQSQLDPMVAFVLLKGRQLGFISKKENMRIPIVGPISQKIGFLPLDRDNPLRAMRTIHFGAKMIKEMGFSMGIYPEGTRSRSGELLEFKTGAFVMAKRAGVPLVVSAISGTKDATRRYPRPTHVNFRVLEVIPAEDVKAMTAEELAEKSREIIAAAL